MDKKRISDNPRTNTPSMAFRGHTPSKSSPSMAIFGYWPSLAGTPHRGDKIQIPSKNLFVHPKIILLCIIFVALSCLNAYGLDMTAPLLFDQMESRSDKIDSMVTQLFMTSGKFHNQVEMAIQSPDKFSIDFLDDSSRIVFDGERLWLYVSSLNEVFFLDTSTSGGWLSDNMRKWVNPKKIITQMTRQTLFALFEVTIVSSIEQNASPAQELNPEPLPASSCYRLRFCPRGGEAMKKIFDVGYYEVDFSKETFLPMVAQEFTQKGLLRGNLQVLGYRLNERLPKERFIFNVPPNVKLIPLATVLAQKIEQGKEGLLKAAETFWDSVINKITDWGI